MKKILITLIGLLLITLTSCGSAVTYKGFVDETIYEYGCTTVYFHDGSTATFQEKVNIVIGEKYQLTVKDKHLVSFIKGDAVFIGNDPTLLEQAISKEFNGVNSYDIEIKSWTDSVSSDYINFSITGKVTK